MCIRTLLMLGLIAIVPACGRVDSSGPATTGAPGVSGSRDAPTPAPRVQAAFYQADEAEDLEAMDLESADPVAVDHELAATEPSEDQQGIAQALGAIELLQDRMDQLHNQHQQILAALGIDDQQPPPPPPAGSLADQVLELREAVDLLAAGNEAMRQAIEEQTVTLKPVLPGTADGKLTVENNTDSDRQMWINGTSYWIWANSQLTVQVPPGQVVTKVSSEQAQTWEIPGPGQEVRIEIVRNSETTADAER
jgi:hypothetical protein